MGKVTKREKNAGRVLACGAAHDASFLAIEQRAPHEEAATPTNVGSRQQVPSEFMGAYEELVPHEEYLTGSAGPFVIPTTSDQRANATLGDRLLRVPSE